MGTEKPAITIRFGMIDAAAVALVVLGIILQHFYVYALHGALAFLAGMLLLAGVTAIRFWKSLRRKNRKAKQPPQ